MDGVSQKGPTPDAQNGGNHTDSQKPPEPRRNGVSTLVQWLICSVVIKLRGLGIGGGLGVTRIDSIRLDPGCPVGKFGAGLGAGGTYSQQPGTCSSVCSENKSPRFTSSLGTQTETREACSVPFAFTVLAAVLPQEARKERVAKSPKGLFWGQFCRGDLSPQALVRQIPHVFPECVCIWRNFAPGFELFEKICVPCSEQKKQHISLASGVEPSKSALVEESL